MLVRSQDSIVLTSNCMMKVIEINQKVFESKRQEHDVKPDFPTDIQNLNISYYFFNYALQPQGLLCDMGQTFQLSPPGVSTRVTTREHPATEGGTVGEKCPIILPKYRLSCYIQGSFTCRKATTWERRLYFPSEGRRAEDFFALKIRRLWLAANPRTWLPKASTLPLDHRSRFQPLLLEPGIPALLQYKLHNDLKDRKNVRRVVQ